MAQRNSRQPAPGASRRAFLAGAGALIAGAPSIVRAQAATLKIGMLLPRSGFFAQAGQGCHRGALIAPASPLAGVATAAEQADFDRAREVLGQGDFRRAADLFAAVAQTHAGGPLTAEALFLRGAALDSAGDLPGAGIAWLESFAADPNGPQAPDSLLGLSRAMSAKGTPADGCYYLQEILARFPAAPQATEAERRMAAADCASAFAGDLPADSGMTDPEAAADLADGQ